MAHTPGPCRTHAWSPKEAEVRAGENTLVAGAALKADARLIAAAPDLLDALEFALLGLEALQKLHPTVTTGGIIRKVEAAIASARGAA